MMNTPTMTPVSLRQQFLQHLEEAKTLRNHVENTPDYARLDKVVAHLNVLSLAVNARDTEALREAVIDLQKNPVANQPAIRELALSIQLELEKEDARNIDPVDTMKQSLADIRAARESIDAGLANATDDTTKNFAASISSSIQILENDLADILQNRTAADTTDRLLHAIDNARDVLVTFTPYIDSIPDINDRTVAANALSAIGLEVNSLALQNISLMSYVPKETPTTPELLGDLRENLMLAVNALNESAAQTPLAARRIPARNALPLQLDDTQLRALHIRMTAVQTNAENRAQATLDGMLDNLPQAEIPALMHEMSGVLFDSVESLPAYTPGKKEHAWLEAIRNDLESAARFIQENAATAPTDELAARLKSAMSLGLQLDMALQNLPEHVKTHDAAIQQSDPKLAKILGALGRPDNNMPPLEQARLHAQTMHGVTFNNEQAALFESMLAGITADFKENIFEDQGAAKKTITALITGKYRGPTNLNKIITDMILAGDSLDQEVLAYAASHAYARADDHASAAGLVREQVKDAIVEYAQALAANPDKMPVIKTGPVNSLGQNMRALDSVIMTPSHTEDAAFKRASANANALLKNLNESLTLMSEIDMPEVQAFASEQRRIAAERINFIANIPQEPAQKRLYMHNVVNATIGLAAELRDNARDFAKTLPKNRDLHVPFDRIIYLFERGNPPKQASTIEVLENMRDRYFVEDGHITLQNEIGQLNAYLEKRIQHVLPAEARDETAKARLINGVLANILKQPNAGQILPLVLKGGFSANRPVDMLINAEHQRQMHFIETHVTTPQTKIENAAFRDLTIATEEPFKDLGKNLKNTVSRTVLALRMAGEKLNFIPAITKMAGSLKQMMAVNQLLKAELQPQIAFINDDNTSTYAPDTLQDIDYKIVIPTPAELAASASLALKTPEQQAVTQATKAERTTAFENARHVLSTLGAASTYLDGLSTNDIQNFVKDYTDATAALTGLHIDTLKSLSAAQDLNTVLKTKAGIDTLADHVDTFMSTYEARLDTLYQDDKTEKDITALNTFGDILTQVKSDYADTIEQLRDAQAGKVTATLNAELRDDLMNAHKTHFKRDDQATVQGTVDTLIQSITEQDDPAMAAFAVHMMLGGKRGLKTLLGRARMAHRAGNADKKNALKNATAQIDKQLARASKIETSLRLQQGLKAVQGALGNAAETAALAPAKITQIMSPVGTSAKRAGLATIKTVGGASALLMDTAKPIGGKAKDLIAKAGEHYEDGSLKTYDALKKAGFNIAGTARGLGQSHLDASIAAHAGIASITGKISDQLAARKQPARIDAATEAQLDTEALRASLAEQYIKHVKDDADRAALVSGRIAGVIRSQRQADAMLATLTTSETDYAQRQLVKDLLAAGNAALNDSVGPSSPENTARLERLVNKHWKTPLRLGNLVKAGFIGKNAKKVSADKDGNVVIDPSVPEKTRAWMTKAHTMLKTAAPSLIFGVSAGYVLKTGLGVATAPLALPGLAVMAGIAVTTVVASRYTHEFATLHAQGERSIVRNVLATVFSGSNAKNAALDVARAPAAIFKTMAAAAKGIGTYAQSQKSGGIRHNLMAFAGSIVNELGTLSKQDLRIGLAGTFSLAGAGIASMIPSVDLAAQDMPAPETIVQPAAPETALPETVTLDPELMNPLMQPALHAPEFTPDMLDGSSASGAQPLQIQESGATQTAPVTQPAPATEAPVSQAPATTETPVPETATPETATPEAAPQDTAPASEPATTQPAETPSQTPAVTDQPDTTTPVDSATDTTAETQPEQTPAETETVSEPDVSAPVTNAEQFIQHPLMQDIAQSWEAIAASPALADNTGAQLAIQRALEGYANGNLQSAIDLIKMTSEAGYWDNSGYTRIIDLQPNAEQALAPLQILQELAQNTESAREAATARGALIHLDDVIARVANAAAATPQVVQDIPLPRMRP